MPRITSPFFMLFTFIYLATSNVTAADNVKYQLKANFLRQSNNNINSTEIDPVKDYFNEFNASLQRKSDSMRLRLKFKGQQYKQMTSNSNTNIEFQTAYKTKSKNDYSIAINKQTYNGTSTNTADDTSSDNFGIKANATYNYDLKNEQAYYIGLGASFKNYSKQSRKDKGLEFSAGYEKTISDKWLVLLDFIWGKNLSSSDYYKNMNLLPMFNLIYMLNENVEFSLGTILNHTRYDKRYASLNATQNLNILEKSTLMTLELGTNITLSNMILLQIKIASNRNSSNSYNASYKSQVFSLGLGLKL